MEQKQEKTIHFEQQEKTITILICEKIDSNNASEISKIYDEIKILNYDKLIMNIKEMNYISSAGLREILKIAKQEGDKFEIINAVSEVYEIFEMTGFTDITAIHKKLREITVDPSMEIGRGANGIVYRLDTENIVKIYNQSVSFKELQTEKSCAKEAFIKGLPTAMSFDLVSCDNNYGIVYELLNAETLGRRIQRDSQHMDSYVEQYINLMKKIHTTSREGTTFPSAKDYYKNKLLSIKQQFSKEELDKCFKLIDSIPDCNTLVHGDLHPNNILLSENELLLIDMESIVYGNPIFDFINTHMVFRYVTPRSDALSLNITGMDSSTAKTFWDKVIQKYFENSSVNIEEITEILDYMYLLTVSTKALTSPRISEDIRTSRIQMIKSEFISKIDEKIDELIPKIAADFSYKPQ